MRVNENKDALFSETAFIAAAHDLKVPLATIRSIALDSERTQEHLEDEYRLIAAQSEQALAVINDLMNVYKFSTAQYKLALCPISANNEMKLVVTEARERDMLNTRRLKAKYIPKKDDEVALADQYMLRRSLSNLINNALKYSDPRTKVLAKVFASGSDICCQVADNGPKLEKTDKSTLRGDWVTAPTKRSAGSSGLGLFLTGEMVRAMNGRVDVESGKSGNFITISFPKLKQQALF